MVDTEEEKKKRMEAQENMWKLICPKVIGKTFFNDVQFINSAEEEKYGSDWQREVCDTIGCPTDIEEEFWTYTGKKLARQMLNRRRQNTTGMMCKKFGGK